jgi:hypothetical protein
MSEKTKEELIKQLGIDIRNRVHSEKLVLTDIFKEAAEKLDNYQDILLLALSVSPERRLDQAIIIIYVGFKMTPEELKDKIKDIMRGGHWDRFSYVQLNIVEDLLGLRRDSLYSLFRSD